MKGPHVRRFRPPNADRMPSRTPLLLAFAAIYLIWGSTYLAIRVAVETMPLAGCLNLRLALLHALVAGHQERFGLGKFLLPGQRATEEAAGVESLPSVR